MERRLRALVACTILSALALAPSAPAMATPPVPYREIEQARAGYRAEADALQLTLDPMERRLEYAWVFDSARYDGR